MEIIESSLLDNETLEKKGLGRAGRNNITIFYMPYCDIWYTHWYFEIFSTSTPGNKIKYHTIYDQTGPTLISVLQKLLKWWLLVLTKWDIWSLSISNMDPMSSQVKTSIITSLLSLENDNIWKRQHLHVVSYHNNDIYCIYWPARGLGFMVVVVGW